ncbi:MAG TPA: RusA family crossover junction endodeoxyribonuclease [Caulobacteraceae bacterium]|nr:RusA family crossover junction endodeoxyribonuclease [Caulobacteraceae bacterium]
MSDGGIEAWTGRGKVRAREADGALTVVVDGLTTQAKYYKPLIYEFFRKEWRGSRPVWGDFAVEILMEFTGDPPWLDLDNLAKAILDAIKGYAFHDDAQVSRLLVERRAGERERITVRVEKRLEAGPQPLQGSRAPQKNSRTP